MQSVWEKYFEAPLKYVKDLLDGADKLYSNLDNRIQRSMLHQVLESKHIDVRRADPNLRSSSYIPVMRRTIDKFVDIQMAIWSKADPLIRGTALFDENLPLELQHEIKRAASRFEDYYKLLIRPMYANLYSEWERFCHSTCYFPIGVMCLTDEEEHREVPVNFEPKEMFDSNGMLEGYDYKVQYGRRMTFKYPKFQTLTPWECRVDLRPRNWSSGWEYFFRIDDMSPDQLYAEVKAIGGDEKNLKKILENHSTGSDINIERPTYGDLDLGGVYSETAGTFRYITGYIRLFNPDEAYYEVRKINFVDGVKEEYALLYEDTESPNDLESYYDERPKFMVSFNNLLLGESFGLSDADITAVLQDETNEAFNLARDAARQGIYPSLLMVKDGWASEPGFLPYSKFQFHNSELQGRSLSDQMIPLHFNAYPKDEILMFGATEERTENMIGTDMVTGQVGLPERKSQTLGQDRMRMEQATRRVVRITGRHTDRFEQLVNTSLEIIKRQVLEGIKPNDLRYCRQPLKAIKKQDCLYDIELSIPHIRSQINSDDNYLKLFGLIQQSVSLMPHFIMGNPKTGMELIHKLWEAAGMAEGFDKTFESIEQGLPETSGMNSENQIQQEEVINA